VFVPIHFLLRLLWSLGLCNEIRKQHNPAVAGARLEKQITVPAGFPDVLSCWSLQLAAALIACELAHGCLNAHWLQKPYPWASCQGFVFTST